MREPRRISSCSGIACVLLIVVVSWSRADVVLDVQVDCCASTLGPALHGHPGGVRGHGSMVAPLHLDGLGCGPLALRFGDDAMAHHAAQCEVTSLARRIRVTIRTIKRWRLRQE